MADWKYIKKNITLTDIAEFETQAAIKLRDELRQFILEHNNGRPKPNGFDTERSRGRVFDKLLSFNQADRENVFTTHVLLAHEIPRHLVAVAADPFGNFICFDKQQELRIVFWEHETATVESTGRQLLELLNELY